MFLAGNTRFIVVHRIPTSLVLPFQFYANKIPVPFALLFLMTHANSFNFVFTFNTFTANQQNNWRLMTIFLFNMENRNDKWLLQLHVCYQIGRHFYQFVIHCAFWFHFFSSELKFRLEFTYFYLYCSISSIITITITNSCYCCLLISLRL